MAYEAAIFDLFGTLIDNLNDSDYSVVLADMAGAVGAVPDDFAQIWKATTKAQMLGIISSMDAYVAHVCNEIGTSPSTSQIAEAVRIRIDYTRRCLLPRRDSVSTLNRLKARGIKTGLISDCTLEVPHLWESTSFADLFDTVVFSCVEGIVKPDPRIYTIACERLVVSPDKCIYVGDGSSRELTGAKETGMHPVLIESPRLDIAGIDRSDCNWDGNRVSTLTDILRLI